MSKQGWRGESHRHSMSARGITTPDRTTFEHAASYAKLHTTLEKLGYKVVDWNPDFTEIELMDVDSFDRKWYSIEDLAQLPPGEYPSRRPPAFQISPKEYGRRRARAVPIAGDITPYNKRLLSKANIWYTAKDDEFGNYRLHVLPEDLHRVIVRPNKRLRVTERVVEVD